MPRTATVLPPGQASLNLVTSAAAAPAAKGIQYTDEQLHARELFSVALKEGESIKLIGYAGATKTTTLDFLARSTKRYGLYLAFNRAPKEAAAARFPKNVRALTTHGLALRSIDSRYPRGDKLFSRANSNSVVDALGLGPVSTGGWTITARQQAASVLAAIENYCNSASDTISAEHVPITGRVARLGEDSAAAFVDHIRKLSWALWARMVTPSDPFPLGPNGYVKLWALGRPRIHADYILLDEAQDTAPVLIDVLKLQHMSRVAVGDPHQQIYAWRGAVNAMDLLPAQRTAYLSQSWRFGPELAGLANTALALLEAPVPMRGNPGVATAIGECPTPHAVLSRSNSGVMSEIVLAIITGGRPHVVGGTQALWRLLEGVRGLTAGIPSDTAELFGYRSWREVEEAVGDGSEPGLKILVQLVNQYGVEQLLAMLARTVEKEEDASVVLSTVHKAKGLEWPTLRVADDFGSPERLTREGLVLDLEELRLMYVAITRAKVALELPPELEEFLAGDTGRAEAWWAGQAQRPQG